MNLPGTLCLKISVHSPRSADLLLTTSMLDTKGTRAFCSQGSKVLKYHLFGNLEINSMFFLNLMKDLCCKIDT